MLRQGNPVLDLLVFVGDRAPNHVVHPNQINPNIPSAYKYDCVNSEVIINRLKVENGKLKLPNGIMYNALVLPKAEVINLIKIMILIMKNRYFIGCVLSLAFLGIGCKNAMKTETFSKEEQAKKERVGIFGTLTIGFLAAAAMASVS